MSFKIITDSTASLKLDYALKNQISIITLYYVSNGEDEPY